MAAVTWALGPLGGVAIVTLLLALLLGWLWDTAVTITRFRATCHQLRRFPRPPWRSWILGHTGLVRGRFWGWGGQGGGSWGGQWGQGGGTKDGGQWGQGGGTWGGYRGQGGGTLGGAQWGQGGGTRWGTTVGQRWDSGGTAREW